MQTGSREYIENNKQKVLAMLDKVKRDTTQLQEYLVSSTYFTDPASRANHANHPGGLAFHSMNVCRIALALNKLHKLGIDEDYIIISSLGHDLCKVNSYMLDSRWKKDDRGKWQSYLTYVSNPNLIQVSHGAESALILSKVFDINEIERQAICWHMGAYNQSSWDNNTMNNCMEHNKLVLLLQQADMASAYIYEEKFAVDAIPFLEEVEI